MLFSLVFGKFIKVDEFTWYFFFFIVQKAANIFFDKGIIKQADRIHYSPRIMETATSLKILLDVPVGDIVVPLQVQDVLVDVVYEMHHFLVLHCIP